MAANPELIQPLVQQLASQNPVIAQILAQNPEALLQILGTDEDVEGDHVPPGAHVVHVTEEERAAIQRVTPSSASFSVVLIPFQAGKSWVSSAYCRRGVLGL